MINPLKYMYYNLLPAELKNKIDILRFPKNDPKNAYFSFFDDTESIFIHIPKTAGTSVSQAIYKEQPKHHPITTYVELDNKKFDKYFKFAFVRNPWDRLYSTFNYAKKISHPVYKGPLSDIAIFDSFEQFVWEWCTEENINSHYFLKPQFDYLTVDGENLAVDFVGYFENLESDFNKVVDKLGIETVLPTINKSTTISDRKNAYNNEMRKRVAELYEKDLKNFDY